MRSTRTNTVAFASIVLLMVAGPLVGCGQAEEHAADAHDAVTDAAHGAADGAAAAVELDPAARDSAIAAVLAAADALDGVTDRVVTKCPGCSLAMDGKAEHAHDVAGYELHFCSASCSDHFNTDTEASLLALRSSLDAS